MRFINKIHYIIYRLRPLTEEEDKNIIENINKTKPDFVWIGLGAPKQEKWMAEHQGTIDMAERIAAKYGVKTINVLTGFKFIGEQIGFLEKQGRTGSAFTGNTIKGKSVAGCYCISGVSI